MIYLDSAATSFYKPESVYTAVLETMRCAGNADRGLNEASLQSGRIVFRTRMLLAQLFHATDPSRIAFTSNSTESLNIAIKGLLSAGDHVITTVMEHNSVLRPLYEMEEKGISVTHIGCDSKGNLLYNDIEKNITPDTKAIICTHASNLTGNVIDLKRVSKIAKEHQLLFVVDASQTAGILDINVEALNISVLCFTGHKSLLGPQGTGGIYVKEGVQIRPLKTGGSGVKTFDKKHPQEMPTALEAGTLNTPGIAGLGAGIQFILDTGIDAIREKEQKLMKQFYDGIKENEKIVIYGDPEAYEHSPVIALNIRNMDSGETGDILSTDYGISVRTGGHCAPLMHKALGTDVTGAVRFSFSYFNTEDDIIAAINALMEI